MRIVRRLASVLNAHPVRSSVLAASLAVGLVGLASLAGLWIACVELFGHGGNPTLPASFASRGAAALAAFALAAALLNSTTEEAVFRGVIQRQLERRLPGVAAVLIASAVFALWHGPTQGFEPWKLAFFLLAGALFGTIARFTRSSLPAIPVHFAGDAMFIGVVWPGDATRQGIDGTFWPAMLVAIGLGLATLALLMWLRTFAATRTSARSVGVVAAIDDRTSSRGGSALRETSTVA